jgi:hypothetical protein
VDGLVRRLDVHVVERAVHAVVTQQVRQRLRVGEVVDVDDLEVLDVALGKRADDAAADAAEPVDGDLGGHVGPRDRQGSGAGQAAAMPRDANRRSGFPGATGLRCDCRARGNVDSVRHDP